MSDKLTVKDLEEMPLHKIFDKGIIKDPNIYEGKEIRWIAKKGGITDWAIYYHEANKDETFVKQYGYKLVERNLIEKLVPCTTEAYLKYRY